MEMLGEFQQNSTNFDARIDSPIPESIILTSLERERSPSSGIGSSMQSSSSSPNYMGDEDQQEYRFYHKLAPKIRHQQSSFSADNFRRPSQRKQTKSRIDQDVAAQRKRGRQSKDEQLAQDNNLPASAEEFAAMSHMEIQKFMRDPKLSALQKSLIKKIRRRGD
jgi:nuclear factor erythroid 2-related factor 2